jgi:hypothetical protein
MHVLSIRLWENKRRKKLKRKNDKESLKWPIVEYALQDVKFLEEVRRLHVIGLDPKSKLVDEHVTTADITKVFGNVHKFRTTNRLITMEIKRKLE